MTSTMQPLPCYATVHTIVKKLQVLSRGLSMVSTGLSESRPDGALDPTNPGRFGIYSCLDSRIGCPLCPVKVSEQAGQASTRLGQQQGWSAVTTAHVLGIS
jgi:hypothetical protein